MNKWLTEDEAADFRQRAIGITQLWGVDFWDPDESHTLEVVEYAHTRTWQAERGANDMLDEHNPEQAPLFYQTLYLANLTQGQWEDMPAIVSLYAGDDIHRTLQAHPGCTFTAHSLVPKPHAAHITLVPGAEVLIVTTSAQTISTTNC